MIRLGERFIQKHKEIPVSVYIGTSEGVGDQIASNRGWSEFIDWVESLWGNFPELNKLVDEGWSNELDHLERELSLALQDSPPGPDTLDVAKGLLEQIRAIGINETIVITNGLISDDGDPTDNEESEFDEYEEWEEYDFEDDDEDWEDEDWSDDDDEYGEDWDDDDDEDYEDDLLEEGGDESDLPFPLTVSHGPSAARLARKSGNGARAVRIAVRVPEAFNRAISVRKARSRAGGTAANGRLTVMTPYPSPLRQKP